MSWEVLNLGDFITMKRGYDLPDSNRVNGEIPIVGSAGITGYHNIAKVFGGGITIGRSGNSFGEVFLCKTDFWPHNATMYINDYKGNVPGFVYYLLRNLNFKNYNSGSAQPSLNRNFLYPIQIRIPDIGVQQKIASILAAYDDLIENNLRRIKLSEEAAQNIYKEWFVNFRFPGNEEAEFNNYIPKGWNKVSFLDVADYINGYPFKPNHHLHSGLPIIKIKELKEGITADTPKNDGGNIPLKYHFDNESILFSWSADLDAYWWSGGKALLNQHLFLVVPFDLKFKEHFYFSLKFAMPEFRNKTTGATMKHIKRSELASVYYLQPSQNIARDFCNIVRPVLLQTINLHTQNQKLKEARDILLPRLMNQTIEVT